MRQVGLSFACASGLVGVLTALSGCGGAAPTMAGGKPVAHWVEQLRSPDARARKHAVEKLGNVGPSDPAAWPAVLAALKDADAAVRREAVLALMKFGQEGREAVATLADLSRRDPSPRVRDYAARALRKLEGEGGK
jgi:HEAT repeat protein